jgi:SNF2 family DNA or RNA helicase
MSKISGDYRVETLVNQISPYFMRVKKSDLNIPAPTVHPPIRVEMHESQRRIYDFIESKYMQDISEEDKQFKSAIVKARMIRLMQAATNPLLLRQPLKEIAEAEGIDLSGVTEDDGILQAVLQYAESEIPAKFEKALEIINTIIASNGKVVVWACYIKTIEMFSNFLSKNGVRNKTLYGATPVASEAITPDSEEYDLTREAIVKEFNDLTSGLNVIIANPFAVAESISLHKACHNAIYIERSFNAAHFIQSKDRIHRYGLPAGTVTNYYYLVSGDSIDETIDERLTIKENRLIEIMESMPIPLFSNVIGEGGDDDVKAVLRDYARRIKTK